MAAPPPEGFSPWPQDVPAAGPAAAGQPGAQSGQPAAPLSPRRRHTDPVPPTPAATPWLWLPVALSSLLLVLFVVIVNRQQAQAQRLGELLGRVQTLEQSRALERTAVLEQQLRAMLTRLQELENRTQQQQQVARQLQELKEEVQRLGRAARSPAPLFGDSPSTPEERPSAPRTAPAGPADP